jgi:hypothetical protein
MGKRVGNLGYVQVPSSTDSGSLTMSFHRWYVDLNPSSLFMRVS